MISLSVRTNLFAPESETARVGGISIPDWSDVEGVHLLRAVDYYDDAAFNALQLGDLRADVEAWREYEARRGDPERRTPKIDEVESVLTVAERDRSYAVFLSL